MKKTFLLVLFPFLLASCSLLPNVQRLSRADKSSINETTSSNYVWSSSSENKQSSSSKQSSSENKQSSSKESSSNKSSSNESSNSNEHEHTYSSTWTSDDYYHWHEATCKHNNLKADKAIHSYSDWFIITEPSETVAGLRRRTCSVCAHNQDEQIPPTKTNENSLKFELNADGQSYMVSAADKTISGEIIIPNRYNNLPVTEIKESGFDDCRSLTLIIIEDGITRINSFAFSGCENVTNIEIPDSVNYIGTAAFTYCSKLEKFYISKNLTEIASYEFLYTRSLFEFNVSSDNKNYCSIDGVLYSKDQKTLVIYPAGKEDKVYNVPSGTESIAYLAFFSCTNLEEVYLPESVTFLAGSSFDQCQVLTKITLSKNISELSQSVFYECGCLREIIVPQDNPYFSSFDGVLFNKDKTVILFYPSGLDAISYQIPNGVTEIYQYAFNSSSLERITIPNTVNKIGTCAFQYCYYLDNVVIPEGVTTIEVFAFSCCSSLKTITLPSTITTFREYAFYGCAFTSFKIPASLKTMEGDAFHCCSKIKYFEVEEGNTHFYTVDGILFSDDGGATTLIRCPGSKFNGPYEIPDNVTRLADGAFAWCFDVKVVIPTSITYLGRCVFGAVKSLTYKGTINQFDKIEKHYQWAECFEAGSIVCSDGEYKPN